MEVEVEVGAINRQTLPAFSAILGEAAQWLDEMGHGLWLLEEVSPERLMDEYALTECFIGHVNGIPAATMVLLESDARFWPNVNPGESLFLHKLSIRRQFAKQGVARQMVMWAENEAGARNKRYLRLDCAADRPKLVLWYENLGFRRIREQMMFEKFPTVFFEKDVGKCLDQVEA